MNAVHQGRISHARCASVEVGRGNVDEANAMPTVEPANPAHLAPTNRAMAIEEYLDEGLSSLHSIRMPDWASRLRKVTRIRLLVSACLLGEEVRYDKEHEYDAFLVESLGPFVITLIKHYVRKYEVGYLARQVFLSPFPAELMLRNHVSLPATSK